MKKILFFLFSPLVGILCIDAQIPIRYQIATPQKADSTDIAYYSKNKKWLQAGTTVFGINMGVWAFDRYAIKGHYAYISLNSMKENFKKGFVWDNDYMRTNLFFHPYHGSLYFNSGRSNGLNYWQSSLMALGGSAMWELFMESEFPSTNDVIATPIGGMALGEVLYRASDLILNDKKTGSARFGLEAAAFIVNPARGLTRIINGDAWRKRSTTGRQFGLPNVGIQVSMGLRILELETPIIDSDFGFATEINIEYGDRYDSGDNKPYDYFSFKMNADFQRNQPILNQLSIVGRLYSGELIDNDKDYLNVGVYQHFDYYDSDTISDVSARVPYRFGTPASFGLGLIYHTKRPKTWGFNAFLHVNGILLGATLSDHYVLNDRDYNLASGFGWKTGLAFVYKDIIGLMAMNETYRMFTWNGYHPDIDWETIDPKTLNKQGDHSQATLTSTSLRLDVKLKNHLYFTAIGYSYIRNTNYKYFEDVKTQTGDSRLMLTYKF